MASVFISFSLREADTSRKAFLSLNIRLLRKLREFLHCWMCPGIGLLPQEDSNNFGSEMKFVFRGVLVSSNGSVGSPVTRVGFRKGVLPCTAVAQAGPAF